MKKLKAKEKRKEKKRLKKEKKKMKKLKKLAEKSELGTAPGGPPLSVSVATLAPGCLETWQSEEAVEQGPAMTDEQKARLSTKRPLTKEEYEARQSVIRRVLDPATGRTRLVRGDGEILEEIVSKEKHKEINKQATKGDGNAFSKRMGINR